MGYLVLGVHFGVLGVVIVSSAMEEKSPILGAYLMYPKWASLLSQKR